MKCNVNYMNVYEHDRVYLNADTALGSESSILGFGPLYMYGYTLLSTNVVSRFPTEMSACLMNGATSLNESLYV